MDVGLVCDGCSTFHPMGSAACDRCGDSLALGDPPAPAPAAAATTGPATRTCPSCRATVAAGNHFCGVCGRRVPERSAEREAVPQPEATARSGKAANSRKTMFFGAMQASRAKLTLIKGDGLDGISFTLAGDDHQAGRIDCPLLFEEDPFLSPLHANFFYRESQLVVRDEDSINGVYVRLRGSEILGDGDAFLVGEQVLCVEALPPIASGPNAEGTYFYASLPPKSAYRIIQQLRGGDTGLIFVPRGNRVTMGRDDNDMNFPDDPFISGRHAELEISSAGVKLTDLNSKNGTFVRVKGERVLAHGDYVFMGQQLLRVEIV